MDTLKNTKFVELTADTVRQQLLNLKQLVFEVTDNCNLKCKYCGYGEFYCSYDKRDARNLSFDNAKILIDYLFTLWREYEVDFYQHALTVSFYGGEPLLNVPFIKQVQEYLETTYAGCLELSYSMTTNAILLDRYMDFLAEKNFNLLISLDGNKEAQSYRVDHHGENSFDRVFKNVKLLQEKYPDYFEKNVNLNSVLHDRNNTVDIYQFMKHEFGKRTMISELNTSGIREDKREQFRGMFLSKQSDFYQALSSYPQLVDEMFYDVADTKMLYLYLEEFSGNIYKYYTDLLVSKKQMPLMPTGTCPPFSKKIFLTVNGKILPCERIDQKYVMGNVKSGKVTLDLKKIAAFYNMVFDKIKKQCTKCYRQKFCMQCIFYIPNVENGGICDGFMNKEEFENFVLTQKEYLRKNPQLYQRIIDELSIY